MIQRRRAEVKANRAVAPRRCEGPLRGRAVKPTQRPESAAQGAAKTRALRLRKPAGSLGYSRHGRGLARALTCPVLVVSGSVLPCQEVRVAKFVASRTSSGVTFRLKASKAANCVKRRTSYGPTWGVSALGRVTEGVAGTVRRCDELRTCGVERRHSHGGATTTTLV